MNGLFRAEVNSRLGSQLADDLIANMGTVPTSPALVVPAERPDASNKYGWGLVF
jgi:hypothetical protein